MHCRGWTVRSLAGCLLFSAIGGCASLDDYRRVEAQNRSLVATREAMDQQLFDARSANSGLRTQVGSLERELNVSKQYIDSMRSENALLDDLRNTAQVALEDIASREVARTTPCGVEAFLRSAPFDGDVRCAARHGQVEVRPALSNR